MGYLASHNPIYRRRDECRRQLNKRASLSPKLWGIAVSLLFLIALLLPVLKVDAQSGRRRPEPSASPRPPAQQRQRRSSTPTTSTETSPAQNKQTATPAPIYLPPVNDPPPWPTPTPKPTPTPASAAAPTGGAETQAGDEVDEADVVRINSNLVTVPASVVDDRGHAVIDLKLEDFELRVDGQPKEISDLGRSETPVRIVMLFDNSMSLAAAREFEKKAAIKFFRSVLRPIDQAAIYSIWTIPIFVQPFTNDVRALVRTIEHFGAPEDGATALFDTVAQAADYLRPYQDRKVIVIVSDGADTLSNMDFLTSLKRVMTADVQVYAVQTGQLESVNLYNLSAHHRLQEYAAQTGGAVYVPRGANDLDDAFAQISADLSQQYVLSYYPQDGYNDGRFRTIGLRVKTRPNVRVRARKGYYDRTGQKQATVPAERMNITVNQPESVRPETKDGAGQSVIPAGGERREMSPTTSSASSVSRRATAVGKAVGPPGPDDDTERTERVESARNTSIPETLPVTPAPSATPTPASGTTATPASPPAPKKTLDGGVLNGNAISLPKPIYPPAAKDLSSAGTVIVEVLIDENGKVISAHAIAGPPALQTAAVEAAWLAKFSPAMLDGQPVQVLGTLTYSFAKP